MSIATLNSKCAERRSCAIALKYFSERFIRKEDIDILKKTRRKYVRHKVINHNGNFVEHLTTEKLMGVVDRDDEIYKMIKEHLEPALEDVWFDEKWRPKNYSYRSLPRELRSHIFAVDQMMYDVAYKEHANGIGADEYNRRVDKLRMLIPDHTDDDFVDYVLLGKTIPTPLGKKAKDSARRAYKTVNGLFKANINRFTHFVTLTFAPEKNREKHLRLNSERKPGEYDFKVDYVDAYDFDTAKKKFTQRMNNFGKKINAKGFDFEYLAVWELQRNGAYHFHMATTPIPLDEQYKIPSWLDYDHRDDKFEKGYGLKYWKHGKSDVQEIRSQAEMSTYLSKYILKSFRNVTDESYEQYLNKRKYFPSKGLIWPEEKYLDDIDVDETLNEFDLDGVVPYEKNYKNTYNDGLITNKIYTLIKEKSPLGVNLNELPAPTGIFDLN